MATAAPGFTASPVLHTLAAAAILREIKTAAEHTEDNPLVALLYPPHLQLPPSSNDVPISSDPHEAEDQRTLEFIKAPGNFHFLVTENATGKAVAFVWWQRSKGKSEEEWAEQWRKRKRTKQMNVELMDATGVRVLKRAKIVGEWEIFWLKNLYVKPEFQRRGHGGRLVEWGVKKADELGLPAYTEATVKGVGLYKRYGFKEVDRVDVDLEKYGGKKGQVNSFELLFREPQA